MCPAESLEPRDGDPGTLKINSGEWIAADRVYDAEEVA